MSEIFDLTNLKDLVHAKHPPAIILVDTNVVIDNSDFSKWQTDLLEPIFILAYSSIFDLAKLMHKRKDSADKAAKALDAILNLTDQGPITKGRHIENVGWLITLQVPSKEIMEPHLSKLGIVREICHDRDASLLLAHKELANAFPNIPVISLTGDKLYTFCGRNFGWLVYNSQSFPIKLQDWLKAKMPKVAIDIDKELQEAVERLEKQVVKVTLTLTSKRLDREWHFESPDGDKRKGVIFAEGEGTLHHPDIGTIGFIWKLPYKPHASIVFAKHPIVGEPDIYEGHPSNAGVNLQPILNFLGRDTEIPASLRLALMVTIGDFKNVHPLHELTEGAPTLQGPVAIAERMMKLLRAIEVWREEKEAKKAKGEKPSAEDIDSLTDAIVEAWDDPYVFESYEDLLDYCVEKYYAKGQTEPEHGFRTLLDSIFSVWNIGHTISFTLPPKEIDEAEEFLSNR